MKHDNIIKIINNKYKKYGSSKYTINEPTSILSHSLKSALWITENIHNYKPQLVVSTLLHDYGLVCKGETSKGETGKGKTNDEHAIIGAIELSKFGFTRDVTEPIRLHVLAKRYLCTINPYYTGVEISLKLQGGYMTDKELLQFERNPYFTDSLILRHADDGSRDISNSKYKSILDFQLIMKEVLMY
jgi:predicted HD phosphohydrolase